jgi:hypothetical protein
MKCVILTILKRIEILQCVLGYGQIYGQPGPLVGLSEVIWQARLPFLGPASRPITTTITDHPNDTTDHISFANPPEAFVCLPPRSASTATTAQLNMVDYTTGRVCMLTSCTALWPQYVTDVIRGTSHLQKPAANKLHKFHKTFA